MTDDPVTPPEEEIDLEALIGNVLESRGYTADRASKLDSLDSLGDNLGKKVEELFKTMQTGGGSGSGSGPSFDQDAFLNRVGEMVDAKLKGVTIPGTTETKKVPALQRLLGVKPS